MRVLNPLLDKDFLKQLDEYRHHDTYARITALSQQELPLERIEGKVSSGSVNIDGSSAVRRTCNLSMIANDVNINDFYWGLHNKFELEVGLKNNINPNYPDVIWFPQGVYVITSFNTNLSTSGFNISISGKDKMCMLNGEIGGSLPASVDFGVEEIVDKEKQITVFKKIPIKKIIKEMLHAFAMEPYHNIIINDIDSAGLELLEYRGDTPCYLLYNTSTSEYDQLIIDPNKTYRIKDTGKEVAVSDPSIIYKSRIDSLQPDTTATIFITDKGEGEYQLSKLEYGQAAGYRLTDLVYAGDLITNIGESITSVLDKIVKMLGTFEYFYDVNGRFIFQKKPIYTQTSWNNIITNDDDTYVENSAYITSCSYYFEGSNLISSFQNAPNLSNLKNDYSVWGSRKTVNDVEVPIHYRYAIHTKPKLYVNLNDEIFDVKQYDWRELIYQMALDYYAHGQDDDFLFRVGQKNTNYPTGITGYEQFYLDMQGFWRGLYDIHPEPKYYQYLYDNKENSPTFSPVNDKGEIIEKLYVRKQYRPCSEHEDRNKVYVFKTYNGEPQLQKLIDTIAVDFNDTSKQYYITAENGYKLVNKEIRDKVEKHELYVKKGDNYIHIADTVSLDSNCYVIEDIDEYIEIPQNLTALFKDGDQYKKYYKQHQLNMAGEVIADAEPQLQYFNYYVKYFDYFTNGNKDTKYWNKMIAEAPDTLDFWIDFMDSSEVHTDDKGNTYTVGSELDRYTIVAIGDRSKVINDSNVKSIYFRDVPNLIYTTYNQLSVSDMIGKTGYTFVFLSDGVLDPSDALKFAYFNISAQGKSAKDKLDELLYNHSYCIESINLSAIPIYYLEPNTRISVRDDSSKINGEYIVSRITLPLTYNGMMSISATKAPQRLY